MDAQRFKRSDVVRQYHGDCTSHVQLSARWRVSTHLPIANGRAAP